MKILVAMSGGVDSSITAKLLKDAGHEVLGCYAKLHGDEAYHERNLANVAKVAAFLGIDYICADLTDEFNEAVYLKFVESYKKGLTPNPCAICNKQIKFGELWRVALQNGCEKMATGHYAKIQNGQIYEAKDATKDQSYFLSNISPEMVEKLVFPLGEWLKTDVKKEAAKFAEISSLATQKESSEICFVPNEYTEILRRHFEVDKKGVVRDTSGKVVGEHEGYAKYTIGKRRGFRVDGAHDPHFVLRIDAKANEIVVGKFDELSCFGFETENLNEFVELGREFEAWVKVRYRSPKVKCRVVRLCGESVGGGENLCDGGESGECVGGGFGGGVRVELAENARAVASGQLAVFYDESGGVVASGFIKRAL